MRRLVLPAITLAALLSASLPAAATGLSMNEVVLVDGTTVDQCKAQGQAALASAGLTALPDSPASVFGTADPDVLAAIYCLPAHGIAMVAVAGSDNAITRPILFNLLGLLQAH